MLNVKVGQRLDAYHDGKISPSRLAVVVVDDIIDRDDFSRKAQRLWKKSLRKDFKNVFDGGCCYYCGPKGLYDTSTTKQFWDWNCREFIVCHILNDKRTEKDPMLFAKRPDGFGWYGVNWNYRLDMSGFLRKRLVSKWKKNAAANGMTMKWNGKELKYDYFDKTGKKVLT
jgi:hypothetical protein